MSPTAQSPSGKWLAEGKGKPSAICDLWKTGIFFVPKKFGGAPTLCFCQANPEKKTKEILVLLNFHVQRFTCKDLDGPRAKKNGGLGPTKTGCYHLPPTAGRPGHFEMPCRGSLLVVEQNVGSEGNGQGTKLTS